MSLEILFKNTNYVLVNKPYDMYINANDESEKNTVACYIATHDCHKSSSEYPLHFVQRLDYSTSGVLCIALNKAAAASAGRLFEKRLTKKYYLAILRGHLNVDLCDIRYSVGVDQTSPDTSHRMVALTTATTAVCGAPRSAHTRLLALETGYYENDPVTVVLLKPTTGRRHQLRVHCSTIGHTILGDYTYSDRKDTAPHRMFLHARRLVLPLHNDHLDIQTTEPFFSDETFTARWKPELVKYDYKEKEDFIKVCDVVDESDAAGVQCPVFE